MGLGLGNGGAAVVGRGPAKGSQEQLKGPVGVGQAESSGEGPRLCHKSISFEESQALISSEPWQGDLISSFICVLKAQRGT